MLNLLFNPFGVTKRWPFVGGMLLILALMMALLMLLGFGVAAIYAAFGANAVNINQHSITDIVTEWQNHDFATVFAPKNFMGLAAIVMLILLGICSFYCKICLTMKRLRDLAVSPWWALFPILASIVVTTPILKSSILTLPIAVVASIFYILLACYPSRLNKKT